MAFQSKSYWNLFLAVALPLSVSITTTVLHYIFHWDYPSLRIFWSMIASVLVVGALLVARMVDRRTWSFVILYLALEFVLVFWIGLLVSVFVYGDAI